MPEDSDTPIHEPDRSAGPQLLTIDEAATVLGQTARQVRYRIISGQLPSTRDGRRILIPRKAVYDLVHPGRHRSDKVAELRETVEKVLGTEPRKGGYSVVDIKAFAVGSPLFAELRERLGATHPAVLDLEQALIYLCLGCHRYGPAEKADAYRQARDLASAAAARLHLGAQQNLATRIEHDVLPAIAGLVRRLDRPRSAVRSS